MSDLVEIICHRCKEPFGLSRPSYEALKRNHHTFCCPWGHEQHFVEGPTEADKLRRERDSLKQNAAYLEDRIRAETAHREAAQRQARAMKGVATRLKNRAANGICPCCNRTFTDLQRHMASKHKGFAEAPIEVAP